ncbi:MAG TPA: DNA repair protein RecN [Thermoanaerobaculia bacterium]|nr:DNA repair protein RecN [Thermoanaerobaculia bacterium]
MLRELHVKNLAVLAEARVELGAGLNVLSGETGAGKSIVVDSLALLAGARASTDLIRTGADTLWLAGLFEVEGEGWRELLAGAGLDAAGDEVLVRREIARSGKSRVFVNDQPTTLRLLAELGPSLLRIHGQRDELGLTTPDLQRDWLDRSGGEAAAPLLGRVADAHGRHARLAERLAGLEGDERARRERLDLLRFQAAEIDAARPLAGEEEDLRAERDLLRHAEAIARGLGGSLGLLFDEEGAAVDRMARAQALLQEIAAWDREAGPWAAELEELRARLAEVAHGIARRLDGLEADPARLDAVEERLAGLERLFRKHGGSSAAVLARRREIEAELAELTGDEEGREELAARAAAALAEYREAALALSAARAGWGRALAERIQAELRDLGLNKARLAVRLERRRRAGSPLLLDGEAVEMGPDGIDQVVFTFAPNPGEEPRPLARIASGGELSRLYLALQVAVYGEALRLAARVDTDEARPTLVFDEVDAGIGGAEAAALGRKLQRLARGGQILAVTHLPQVASHADLHFRVSKRVEKGRTQVAVERLERASRVEEVARMLAGSEVTRLSLSHARELIAAAAAR